MSGDSNNFTDTFAREKAARFGCSIDYSDDYTLQLDLDGDEAYEVYLRQIALLQELELVRVHDSEARRSRTGNHHVIIKLLWPVPVERRILLQALLGSDRKREMLAFAGMLRGQENPVLLFRPAQDLGSLL
jgi:hypothetical protein